jgi:hypothetical protein
VNGLPKKEKQKKKNWKERQRERQIRQQRAQEAYQIQREREAEKRPRKWPKGKVIFGFCLIAIVVAAYGTWQYFEGQKPPAIGGTTGNLPTNNPSSASSAPSFSLTDINGNQFSLNQHIGKVIAIHFMAVGCSGQIYPINDYQLKQLKETCNDYCGDNPVVMVTVAVATCPNSQLSSIRTNYGITWALGNDYDDGNMDIVKKYVESYSINDGTIVLIDKKFNVVEVYTEATSAETLSSKINQLLKA